MTNMDLSNPPGDNAFLHDLELTVQTELTMAGTSQAVEEADGEPGDERLPDTHVEHYVVRLRTLLGAIEASEDDFRTRLRAPLGAAGEDRLRPASLADAYVARGTPTAQQGGELCPRGDLELGENPVQVRADGAMRQVQPLTDLPIGQAFGRQPDDLQFLGGQGRQSGDRSR